MSNDDPREPKTPARQDESIATRLDDIDELTRGLLAEVREPRDTALEGADRETRAAARKHVLEIRAQASQLGIRVLGPEGAIPYRPEDDPDRGGSPPGHGPSIATTYTGPDPESLEHERRRSSDDVDEAETHADETEPEADGTEPEADGTETDADGTSIDDETADRDGDDRPDATDRDEQHTEEEDQNDD